MKARSPVLMLALAISSPMSLCVLPVRAAEPESTPYRIVDGKVDESTYLGWRAFHSGCHSCHGVAAVGTDIAPNLLERIRMLSPSDFSIKVLTSYRVVVPADEFAPDSPSAAREQIIAQVLRRERGELIMPAWEGDPEVSPYLIDIYTYLRARSDGALGPERPQRAKTMSDADTTRR